ncbi:MAG: glycerol-3-phosphate dehydrogenase, partial [Aquificota bacterium]
EEALKRLNQTVEGIHTVRAVQRLAMDRKIHTPINNAVYRVVVEGYPPKDVALELLKRPPQSPFEMI